MFKIFYQHIKSYGRFSEEVSIENITASTLTLINYYLPEVQFNGTLFCK